MSTTFQPNTFCWWELSTTDQNAAEQFYGSLLGWTASRSPMGPDAFYTTFQVGGQSVAAAYQKGPEDNAFPPAWTTYILVDNVDETTAKVAPAGGTVMMEPFDVMTFGRMAVIADPTGAVVAFWQAKEHPGAQLVSAIGANCWNELATRDVARAAEFFKAVLGWDTENLQNMPSGAYTMIKIGDKNIGGMLPMDENWPQGVPPHWMPYFAVSDCDATAAKAKELGGKVTVESFDVAQVGRMAVLSDPQGAHFTIMKVIGID